MRQVDLGGSGLRVADWALGTMTFGNQTPEDDAHRQMDLARARGITLLDCAEMYPVNPVRPETWGRSEAFIGSWLRARGGRDGVVIATKMAGPRNQIRGEEGYEGGVRAACEASLRRLGTEVIDLYQLHWPERPAYSFRRNWRFRPDPAGAERHMDAVLRELAELVAEGKVRAVGLSNETAWGLLRWRDRARALGLPLMETIQNEYSLMARLYDTDLAEAAVAEGVTLLAYSPLAAGLLSGKYQGGAIPPGSRLAVGDGRLGGRLSARAPAVVAAYLAVAAEAGLDPLHMALAWHRTRPFPSIPLLGATTAAQLERQLGGLDLELSEAVIQRIDEVNVAHPLPF